MSGVGLLKKSGCLLHAILELEGFLRGENRGVVAVGKGDFTADLGHGGDEVEHELLVVHSLYKLLFNFKLRSSSTTTQRPP